MTNRLFNKYDVIITALSLGAAVFFALFFFARREAAPGARVKVTAFGEVIAELPLSEDTPSLEVITEYGANIIEVASGKARMVSSDCHDAYCVRTGAISRGGQTIVCLPHGIVVEIIGSGEMDAVTY